MFRDDKKQQHDVETVIGRSVHVEGNFVGEGNVTIDGSVSGTVKTKGDLRIGPDASIKADVEASSITLAGSIQGNVTAKDHLDLAETAHIRGNVTTNTLTVARGARINGKCAMKNGNDDGVEAANETTSANGKTNKTKSS